MLTIGSVLDGRYEVLKEIGRGGMSIVYLAMDNRLNKSVAVKDIRKQDTKHNEILINSLEVEANTLKRLDHGSLPKIYDIIEAAGDIYVVMDYIEGETLQEKFDREGPASAGEVTNWAKQLSDVLSYLHTRKPNPIIYRDMKPGNIMLTPEGDIKLIDFGISREYKEEKTTDTTNLGTKAYAAPEQITGLQSDARTDIYSLGVTLYYLVTGKSLSEPPFEIMSIRHWDPSLPEGLDHIILKCTRLEPGNRYQTCIELLHDLENIDKLTQGYKRSLYKRLITFLIPTFLLVLFIFISLLGFNGMKKEKFLDYMNLINEASIALVDGKDSRAISLLEEAITVDNRRSNAYKSLLDLHVNRNETDVGLSKIESYVNDKYGNVHKNDDVLFKLGITYFDIKRDYQSALKYFRQIDEEAVGDAKYYKSLAMILSSLNIDYHEFSEYLLEFEEYNDSLPNDHRKIENYNALANIFISYKSQINKANTIAINIINKALKLLKVIDDEQLSLIYETNLKRKLAQSYYSRAINSKDQLEAREDYEMAIEHYRNLVVEDSLNVERHLVTVGVIYREMDENYMAEEQFRSIIHDYPENIEAYIQLGNLLTDMEQSKDEEKRNYQMVLKVYEEASDVPGIEEHESFIKFERRLESLGLN